MFRRPEVHKSWGTFLNITAGDSGFYPLSGPSRTRPGACAFYFLNEYFTFNLFFILLCMCVHTYVCTVVYRWKSEDSLWVLGVRLRPSSLAISAFIYKTF